MTIAMFLAIYVGAGYLTAWGVIATHNTLEWDQALGPGPKSTLLVVFALPYAVYRKLRWNKENRC